MNMRTLSASALLLASLLAGAPGAAAAPLAAPAAVVAPDDDQAGTTGLGKGASDFACRAWGFWCQTP